MGKLRTERPKNKRLIAAFEYAGYDVMEKNFTRTVARKMLLGDNPIIEWAAEYDPKKELESKIASVSRSINKHLSYADCTAISGDWIVRYARFLNVNTDFLYGITKLPLHEHTDISAYTGLSVKAVDTLHKIHTRKWKVVDTEYTEPHKAIDFLNIILDKKTGSGLLRDMWEYIHSKNIVMPPEVSLWDDTGTGHTIPAAALYHAAKREDIIAGLDCIAKK